MQKASVKKTSGTKQAGAELRRPAQDRFLTELVKDRRAVAIFLINGLKLEGRIVSFDDYAILLENDLSDHVYKHAISTIQPVTTANAKKIGGTKVSSRSAAKTAPQLFESDYSPTPVEAKPRQPIIVVRTKRRIIKTPPGDS